MMGEMLPEIGKSFSAFANNPEGVKKMEEDTLMWALDIVAGGWAAGKTTKGGIRAKKASGAWIRDPLGLDKMMDKAMRDGIEFTTRSQRTVIDGTLSFLEDRHPRPGKVIGHHPKPLTFLGMIFPQIQRRPLTICSPVQSDWHPRMWLA